MEVVGGEAAIFFVVGLDVVVGKGEGTPGHEPYVRQGTKAGENLGGGFDPHPGHQLSAGATSFTLKRLAGTRVGRGGADSGEVAGNGN